MRGGGCHKSAIYPPEILTLHYIDSVVDGLKLGGPCWFDVKPHQTYASQITPLMVASTHCRTDVLEGLIRAHEAGQNIALTALCVDGVSSAATLAFNAGFFEIAQRLYDLGAPLAAERVVELVAKGLPHGELPVPPRPFELLAQSMTTSPDSRELMMVRGMQELRVQFLDFMHHNTPLMEESSEIRALRAHNAFLSQRVEAIEKEQRKATEQASMKFSLVMAQNADLMRMMEQLVRNSTEPSAAGPGSGSG